MFLAPRKPALPETVPSCRRSIPYLVPHRDALFFRIRIPADLQACLGKTEYRRSLGRCYRLEIKVRALKLAAAAHEVFSFVRMVLQQREQSLTSAPLVCKSAAVSGYTSGHLCGGEMGLVHISAATTLLVDKRYRSDLFSGSLTPSPNWVVRLRQSG